MHKLSRRAIVAMPLVGSVIAALPAWARRGLGRILGTQDGEWPTYGGDLRQHRYSALDQIDADNFSNLEVAWRLKSDAFGAHPEYQYESTPLVVGGVLYTTIGSYRSVVALDAASGEILWTHREDEGVRAERAPRRLSGRGLAYWSDGIAQRILYVTIGYRLICLDARTGERVPDFGEDGVVDLRLNDDQDLDLINADIGLHAAPTVAKDVVIVGAAHTAGNMPKKRKSAKGYVRGFDVRTGKRLWIFHTIPQNGEYGYDTWLEGTDDVGHAGVWGQIAVDEELNLAYLGVELPTGDTIGKYRPGAGLFGESIVAVDLHTGRRKWDYQMVHHGLWDYDVPCAAILCDIPHGGRIVKALAQPGKQAFLYVLNRETGEPVWPIPEKPVPTGDVPGEWYSPTQPFPTRPPAYDRQGFGPDVLIDFTPELNAEARRLIKNYKYGPMFTPESVATPDGTWGTLTLPNLTGGTNWPGGCYDPESHIVFVYSQTVADVMMAIPNSNPERSEFDYINVRHMAAERDGFRAGNLKVQGLPLVRPPWGRISAIDLSSGDIRWQVAHGETPDEVKNHPALKGLNIPRTGQWSYLIGPIVTKTLLICGEPLFTTMADGRRGAMLRAYDKVTGQEKGAVYMPAPQSGVPMTYSINGRQHIVLAISGGVFSGGSYGGELIAFRLPK